MNTEFSIDEYMNKCILYAIEMDYTPRMVKVIKYMLKNIVYDARKHIAFFLCQHEEIYKATGVSRVTISKTMQVLQDCNLITRDTYLVIRFNLDFFASCPEEEEG